jgi:hypothetical protein
LDSLTTKEKTEVHNPAVKIMEKDIDQVIKERLQILPPDIKKAINELDWGKTVLPIGKKNGLSIEQMGDLQQQTVFVLIGLLHPNEYFDAIKNTLGIDAVKTTTLVADMNEAVFKTIKQKLIDFYDEETRATTAGEPQTDPLKSAGLEIIPDSSPIEEETESQIQGGDYEKSMLQKSGVNIEDATPVVDAVVKEERGDLLNTLENPPKTALTGFSKFVETQRTQPITAPVQKTSYTEPKTTPPQPQKDPYREPIN